MNKILIEAVNKQIQRELESAYLYLGMQTYFKANAYDGFANWFYVQALEEMTHVVRFQKFLLAKNCTVELYDINKVPTLYLSPFAAFEKTLEHEKLVTDYINDLYDLSISEKDDSLKVMLHWFVQEQVEEVDMVRNIVQKLKRFENDQAAIQELDEELGERKFEA